jgi:hypothetical protein
MTPELFDSGAPRDQTAILASIFVDAQKRMAEMVLKPKGTTQGAREFRQARAASQIAQVDQILRQLKQGTASWLQQDASLKKPVREARQLADRQAEEAGVRVESALSGSFDQVDVRTAAVFASQIAADLAGPDGAAERMADRTKRVLRQTAQVGLDESQINRILAGGVIEGKPVETIRRLRDELKAVHGGTVTITDKNGDPREFEVGRYAEMVARTQTRQATVTARHERLGELGLNLVVIVGRVSPYFCTAFLGQAFSLSGRHPKYPPYGSLPGGGPPFHPNCSKSTRPFVEELAEPQQLADAEPLEDTRKLLGMDTSRAQRSFKDLQLQAQVKDRYATTEQQLFGGGSKAA